ncbi:MAG: glycosyltransferase family 2 protein, partial [Candidatus Paceibacteria bacterium]
MSRESISVVVTCYNEEDYIGKALDSVLNQSAFDRIGEVLVIDDGSEDGSADIIDRYESNNEKIKGIFQQNKGLSSARNEGIRESNHKYIALLDGDDMWRRNKIKIQHNYAKKLPNVGLFYTNVIKFNSGKKYRKANSYLHYQPPSQILKRYFVNKGPVIPSTCFLRKECFENVGLFDVRLKKREEVDMWLRIFSTYRVQHIDDYLVYKRERKDSLGSNGPETVRYTKKVIEKSVNRFQQLEPLKHKRL